MKPQKRLIFFLLFSVLLISFAFYAYQICYTPNILVGKSDIAMVIPKGATFKDVQDEFHKGNIAQDLISFSFLSKLMDYDESVKSGRYILRANMTNIEAIRLLRSGQQEPVKITFNNVRLISELSEKITRNLYMKPEEFEAALIQFTMNNNHGFTKENILTMFIPNTYEVYYQSTPQELIQRMYNEYSNFWSADRKAKA